jgi:hypothetical protein
MDSTGLGAVVSIYNHANKADVVVIVENVPDRIYKIMAITGMTTASPSSSPYSSGPDPMPTSSGRVQWPRRWRFVGRVGWCARDVGLTLSFICNVRLDGARLREAA